MTQDQEPRPSRKSEAVDWRRYAEALEALLRNYQEAARLGNIPTGDIMGTAETVKAIWTAPSSVKASSRA